MNTRINTIRTARKIRVRNKIKAHSLRPRLVITRTNEHIYAQVVDRTGKVIVSASDLQLETTGKQTKTERAKAVGEVLGKQAKSAKLTQVALDRGNYKYHGRVKALAEAARSQGMEF